MDLGPFFAVDSGPGSSLSHVRFALLTGLILMTQQHLGGTTSPLLTTSTNTSVPSSSSTPVGATFATPNHASASANTTASTTTSHATSATNSTTFGQVMLHREGLWSLALLNSHYQPPSPTTTEGGFSPIPGPTAKASPSSSANSNPNLRASPSSNANSSPSPGSGAVSSWPVLLCVDPVDCVNSVLSLQAGDMFPSAAWGGGGVSTQALRETITSLSSTAQRPGLGQGLGPGIGFSPGSGLGSATGPGLGPGLIFEESIPLDDGVQRMRASGVALVDMLVLVCMIGRPDGTLETTPNRLYQATILWRRTSLAILSALAHPPSSEYSRLSQRIGAHMGQQHQPHREKTTSHSPTPHQGAPGASLGGRNAQNASMAPLVSIVCCSALEAVEVHHIHHIIFITIRPFAHTLSPLPSFCNLY